MISINQVSLPSPASLSVRTAIKGGTAQYNTMGQLVQDGMKKKRQVEIIWNRMPASFLSALAQLLEENDFLSLIYPDPLQGQRLMECRVLEHTARAWRYENGQTQWADVKLSLEER